MDLEWEKQDLQDSNTWKKVIFISDLIKRFNVQNLESNFYKVKMNLKILIVWSLIKCKFID